MYAGSCRTAADQPAAITAHQPAVTAADRCRPRPRLRTWLRRCLRSIHLRAHTLAEASAPMQHAAGAFAAMQSAAGTSFATQPASEASAAMQPA
eukprot:359144-Chlamydomonas_euryale.AAC.3